MNFSRRRGRSIYHLLKFMRLIFNYIKKDKIMFKFIKEHPKTFFTAWVAPIFVYLGWKNLYKIIYKKKRNER